MVLTFDDIIWSQTFTIKAKGEEMDVIVSITDTESEELGQVMDSLLAGNESDDAVEKILFKEQLPKMKELLIGANYVKFTWAVIGEYVNFINASLLEARGITKPQQTEQE